MLVNAQQFAVLLFHFQRHTLIAADAAFQIRHTHDVVKRHPQSQPTGGLAAGCMAIGMRGVDGVFRVQHLLQALHIPHGVSAVLVIAESGETQRCQFPHIGRKATKCGFISRRYWLVSIVISPHGLHGLRLAHTLESSGESAQAGGAAAAGANRRFVMRACHGKHSAGRDRAEHDGADHGALLFGHGGKIPDLRFA